MEFVHVIDILITIKKEVFTIDQNQLYAMVFINTNKLYYIKSHTLNEAQMVFLKNVSTNKKQILYKITIHIDTCISIINSLSILYPHVNSFKGS